MFFHDSSAIPPVNTDIVVGLVRKIGTVTKSKKKIEGKNREEDGKWLWSENTQHQLQILKLFSSNSTLDM